MKEEKEEDKKEEGGGMSRGSKTRKDPEGRREKMESDDGGNPP